MKNRIKIQGSWMYLDDQDSLGLKKNGIYEPIETMLIPYLINKDSVCLDVGAHTGYFTILMAKLCKAVFAFEADQTNFKILKENIELNNLENVLAQNVAVGDHYGWIPLYLCNDNSGMHRIYPSKHCTDVKMSVPMVALDSTYHKIDFIKMDIEGSELGALKGMQYLLKINHPKMIIEFHPPSIEEYGALPKDEYDFLKGLDYSIRLIPRISIPISFEELDIETRKEPARNILCIKEGEKLF